MEGISARTHPRQESHIINLSRDHPLVGSPQRRFKEPLGRSRPLSLDRPHVNTRRYGALKRWLSEEVSGVIREEEEEAGESAPAACASSSCGAEGGGSGVASRGADQDKTGDPQSCQEEDRLFAASVAENLLALLSTLSESPPVKTDLKIKVLSFLASLHDQYKQPL